MSNKAAPQMFANELGRFADRFEKITEKQKKNVFVFPII